MKRSCDESFIRQQVEEQLIGIEQNLEAIQETVSFLMDKIRIMVLTKKHYLLTTDSKGRDWRITGQN